MRRRKREREPRKFRLYTFHAPLPEYWLRLVQCILEARMEIFNRITRSLSKDNDSEVIQGILDGIIDAVLENGRSSRTVHQSRP